MKTTETRGYRNLLCRCNQPRKDARDQRQHFYQRSYQEYDLELHMFLPIVESLQQRTQVIIGLPELHQAVNHRDGPTLAR